MSVLLDTTDRRPVHFMGIGGAGMSALAELLIRRGVPVTGCDIEASGIADIAAHGVQVDSVHAQAHVDGARALVYTSAVDQAEPELVYARSVGIPVLRRADALSEIVQTGRVVGVAGTHGKTTTTAMIAEALAEAGENPTALVGGRVSAWSGNLRRGSDALYVVEADEYDRSFLALRPDIAVVTNIEPDHLDIYGSLDNLRDAFAVYVERAPAVVLCADDPVANALRLGEHSDVVRYGVSNGGARLTARGLRVEAGTSAFLVWFDGELIGEVHLQVPGEHNVRNALAAIGAGLLLGKPVADLARGLAAFSGVERRFQRLGESRGVAIVDDYAHHPTEIRATIAAARTAFPGRRLVVAFQPHLYTRTRDFASEFGSALAQADVVLVADIYAAREHPIPGVTSALVTDAAQQAGAVVVWSGPRTEVAPVLATIAKPGDVVMTLGAGDITRCGPELLRRLVEGE
jgi:UDP-N-acetylmuramate--alanine ligase